MKDSKITKILRFIALIFSSLSIVTTSIIGIVSIVTSDKLSTPEVEVNSETENSQEGIL